MRSFLRITWLALALPALVACGSIDDPNERKPLAVIEGQMLQAQNAPSVQVQSNVRIAVVWLGIDDRSLKSTQDVKAEAVFPSKFKLALTEPPPDDAMIRKDKRVKDDNDAPSVPGSPPSGGGSAGSSGGNPDQPPPPQPAPKMRTQSYKQWPADFGIAVGAVVAYEDLNGNGKLDLVDDNATQYVDRVLGINQELFLVYVEGQNVPQEMLPPNGSKPVPGFNLLQRIEKECPKTDDFCSPSLDVRWLPMSSLYDLPLSAEPRFGDIMCKGKEGFGDSVSETSQLRDPNDHPAPNDPNLKCSEDGKSYTYEKCTTIDRGLCKGTVSSCERFGASFGGTATMPAPNWPCPVK